MIRTILVTECENRITKEIRNFYGRYDPVTLERGNWKILDSYPAMFSMTDETFVRYGKRLRKKEK